VFGDVPNFAGENDVHEATSVGHVRQASATGQFVLAGDAKRVCGVIPAAKRSKTVA
jgi:hypothetical protein